MKIVLLHPNQTELDDLLVKYRYLPGYRPKPLIPLGMLYLCSNIDHEVVFIDNNIKKYPNKRLFKEILKVRPDIVGFGGTMMEWVQARKVAKMLQETNIPTIYGGPNATVNSEKHIRYFDYVVRGEGEVTLNELLTALEQGTDLRRVDGVWFKRGSSIVRNPERGFVKDLDKLKYPARHLIDINNYSRKPGAFLCEEPCDVVVSSRGCPYDCRFCSSTYFWKRTYRVRSTDEVIKEIKFMMKNYGTKTIHFREDLFTVNRKRVLQFCGKLNKLGIEWICQSRVDDIDEELMKRMKDAGCVGVSFGFESANDDTLEYLNKRITIKQSIEAINICEKVGMNWAGGFMVGVLNETEKHIRNTLAFVKRIRKYPHSYLSPGAARFLGFPASKTYFEMQKEGLVAGNWEDGELLIPKTYHLSAKQVEAIMRKEEYLRSNIFVKVKSWVRTLLKVISPRPFFVKVRYIRRRISG